MFRLGSLASIIPPQGGESATPQRAAKRATSSSKTDSDRRRLPQQNADAVGEAKQKTSETLICIS